MIAVGVKKLKAQLSEYLRRAKAGETILVTDREEVIAELRPARRQRRPTEDADEALDALADSGDITRASEDKEGWTWSTKGLRLRDGTAADLLGELRGDR